MDDLVKRLRRNTIADSFTAAHEAADAIERLRFEHNAAHQEAAELRARLVEVEKERDRQKECIRSLTDQCAALVVEKNTLIMDHGGSLCDKAKFEFLEAILAGDAALIQGLKNDVSAVTKERDEWKESALNGGNAGYLRDQINACNEFLKDGESVYERMVRFHKDLIAELGLHAKLKLELEAYQKDAEHLRELLTVLWIAQGPHQRDTWDAKAVAAFDAAMKEQTT